jgi:hypothetical protein
MSFTHALAAVVALWALSAAPQSAHAQAGPAGRAQPPDPLDPQATVPPAAAPAGLRRYRAATTPEPGGWREANERVARIGGWKTYLREAQQPEAPGPAASAPAVPAAAPAPVRQPEHRHGRH